MSLEVVWSGSTWRQFPVIEAAPTPEAEPKCYYSDRTMQKIRQCIGDVEMSIADIRAASGACDAAVRAVVRKLVSAGVLSVSLTTRKQARGGHPMKLYRKVQRQEQVASGEIIDTLQAVFG